MRVSRQKEAVVLGGSLGSIEALRELLPVIPTDYPLCMIVVLHQYRFGPNGLVPLLQNCTKLPVVPIEDKGHCRAGQLHVCPPNYHVLVEDDRSFSLTTDLPVQFARPSLDVVFESASSVWGPSLVGVLLSGASADGVEGLQRIQERGGWVACQDPKTAVAPMMPRSASEKMALDWVGSPVELGRRLASLC